MVVSEETAKPRKPELKKFIGNNLTLNLSGKKKRNFLIVGNNSSVTIRENLADFKVVGDNCRVEVLSGGGSVCYVGNNGAVFLGDGVDEDSVEYMGNNGVVCKGGKIRRSSSDGDVRKVGGKVKVVNIDGEQNVCLGKVRTRYVNAEFLRVSATVSLPSVHAAVVASVHKK